MASSQLRKLKEFQKEVESQLSILEKQLFEFETEYIEQTAGSGNLAQGFDGFQDRSGGGDWNADRRWRLQCALVLTFIVVVTTVNLASIPC
jgi:chromatin modification-related protein EAF6